MRSFRPLLLAAVLAAVPLGATASYLFAQGAPPPGAPQGGAGGAGNPLALGNELVAALKATKGCLGVELASTPSRKAAIFAWFEDKAAAMRWYESEYHAHMIAGFESAQRKGADGSAHAPRIPMEHVQDGVPVMCIATITPSAQPAIPGFPMPISQISIELYTPLAGGLALNGRFAPSALKVPGMVEANFAPPAAAAPAAK